MTVEFLKAKYGMTILEANVFINWNLKGFVADGMDFVLVKALRKLA